MGRPHGPCNVGSEILAYLLPGMIISVFFVILVVARTMGRQERKRLGITQMSAEEINALTVVDDPETAAMRRPKLFLFNLCLTIVLIGWLVAGAFISEIERVSLEFAGEVVTMKHESYLNVYIRIRSPYLER